MSLPKHLSLILIASLPFCASLSEAHDLKAPEALVLEQFHQQVLVPDEARIASDLKGHAVFASSAPLRNRLDGPDDADWTSIRSSVRKGEVLEFRVTSMFEAATDGGPQHEVDSIISYQLNAQGWELVGVKTEGTRDVLTRQTQNPGEPC